MATHFRHWFRAFGLTLDSVFEIPELPRSSGSGDPDVVVSRRLIDRPEDAENGRIVHRRSGEELLLCHKAAVISIRSGCDIAVDSDPSVPNEVLRHLLIGPVFNHLLYQRGFFVLHAITVEIDGSAVAFVGESGVGKTTTAMAFLRAGHRVLSDDVAAIESDGDRPHMRSGYPSIKLDPAVVGRFDVPVEQPQQTSPTRDRYFHGLKHEQPDSPVLERIYFLADARRHAIVPVESPERVLEPVRNTYTIGLLEETDQAERNFDRTAGLAESVPVRRLHRQRGLKTLSELVGVVEADLDGNSDYERYSTKTDA